MGRRPPSSTSLWHEQYFRVKPKSISQSSSKPTDLFSVFLGVPLFLLPCRFQLSDWCWMHSPCLHFEWCLANRSSKCSWGNDLWMFARSSWCVWSLARFLSHREELLSHLSWADVQRLDFDFQIFIHSTFSICFVVSSRILVITKVSLVVNPPVYRAGGLDSIPRPDKTRALFKEKLLPLLSYLQMVKFSHFVR